MVIDDEVMITGTHKGAPPARTILAKFLDGKEQVVSRPYESILIILLLKICIGDRRLALLSNMA